MDSLSLSQNSFVGVMCRHSPMLSLRANVSQSDALRLFSAPNVPNLVLRLRKGVLQRIASAYVPFALYRVSYKTGNKRRVQLFALDQVEGTLDPFAFAGELDPGELVEQSSSNRLPSALSEEKSESLILEKVMRLLFQRGFFHLGNPDLHIDQKIMEFSIPYWLGFYGEDGALHCRVLDAVRNRMEGDKATKCFENWLTGA
jgi:hypothetical protein